MLKSPEPAKTTSVSNFSREQTVKQDLLDHRARARSFEGLLQEAFANRGYTPSSRTRAIWWSLAIAEAPLDHILDSGEYEEPIRAYNSSVDFILGYSDDLPPHGFHDKAVSMLKEVKWGLEPLDEFQRQGMRELAREIAVVDTKIKRTKSPFELARLRRIEGDLEVQIFALAVPKSERGPDTKFDAVVKELRKEVGVSNIGDSWDDFKEDSGVAHKVKGWHNRAIFTGILIGANRNNLIPKDLAEILGIKKPSFRKAK